MENKQVKYGKLTDYLQNTGKAVTVEQPMSISQFIALGRKIGFDKLRVDASTSHS